MNVFYEEDGGFKVGAVLADNNSALQVEAAHGKRSKIKSSAVLVRFVEPGLGVFMETAQHIAEAIDLGFLWECCGTDEFSFDTLSAEYFGRSPTPVEAAALLLRLHSAPMYFYKKGKGRYKAAPADALKAALASVEKKRLQAELKQSYVESLVTGRLPVEFQPLVAKLLYAPDRNSIEWKALEAAAAELKIPPPRVFEKCGALASPHDYHLNRFLFEHFPRGTQFSHLPLPDIAQDLPRAEVRAFSIDDVSTTEIDDAFSVSFLDNGRVRIGVHIAVPALAVTPQSAVDAIARERLSTVYFPGRKITMLPETAIADYTLSAGQECPALSLYVEVNADGTIVSCHSRSELVMVAANLRHGELDHVFNAPALKAGPIAHEFGDELAKLWQLALTLERGRGKSDADADQRPEFSFYVEDDRVRIVQRPRGTPVDKVVSEFMIFANTEWGRQLAEAQYPAIYRVQSGGVARMTTAPGPHDGLGVAQYAWASSPLRRYVDLINQRQLLALFAQQPPIYVQGDATLLAALRDFELAYDAYGEFQRNMERYWCLRWIAQEQVSEVMGAVIRDNLVRLELLPLVVRVPSLRQCAVGDRVRVGLSRIDPWELTLHADFVGKIA